MSVIVLVPGGINSVVQIDYNTIIIKTIKRVTERSVSQNFGNIIPSIKSSAIMERQLIQLNSSNRNGANLLHQMVWEWS